MVEAGDDTVKCLTTKEIKKLAKPEFEANPEKFYPTETFKKLGYSRTRCPKCSNYYWRHSEKADTCGDSQCVGSYTFIGKGLGKDGKKITYADAWKGYMESFTTAPNTPLKVVQRYPVVARWRNDVEYTAAGIYCFQPYCVTGELEPPANPLIQPQFCARFNDLDNIGITGRHYSGFIMLGQQVFNLPDKYIFFKDECVQFNYRWLTETLEIHPDEITFIEDVWAGGGNLGPSIEYFVRGLEVGNMVFMQYKTFHDGSREELQVKVIDVGIGLERVSWLMNGTATSYADTFKSAMEFFQSKVDVRINEEIWNKFGPYSCQLNIDEIEHIDKTWQEISDKIGVPVADVKQAIAPVKEMFIILDHTRTLMMIIQDGSLPSNVGGGGNVRNILRRCFNILHKNDWWKPLGEMDGFLQIFKKHQEDLEGIYGKFDEYKSFGNILTEEFKKWQTTDEKQTAQLDKLLKKNKGILTLNDWIVLVTSHGIPADKVAEIAKLEVPGNLYYAIAELQEKIAKKAETILYNTAHLPETKNLYYENHKNYHFQAKCVEVFTNVQKPFEGKQNLLILDQSGIYPTSGGQEHDTGVVEVEGIDTKFQIVNALKVGKVVMHVLDQEITEDIKGRKVTVTIDEARRNTLRAHHTGTHIVFAACRRVLGPHIWQNGAKKTTESAHLDITHYRSLTKEQEQAIENEANRIISGCTLIQKGMMNKAEAEQQYGFSLYQGGIVPGNELRVVNIDGIDTEACCGTHCDNTAEVGWVRMLKTQSVKDGVIRLYYACNERAIQVMNHEQDILNSLCKDYGIEQGHILQTCDRFFNESKTFGERVRKQDMTILELQLKCITTDQQNKQFIFKSDQSAPTFYISFLPKFAETLKAQGKSAIFVGSTFVAGICGDVSHFNLDLVKEIVVANSSKMTNAKVNDKVKFDEKIKGKNAVTTDRIVQVLITGADFKVDEIVEGLKKGLNFQES